MQKETKMPTGVQSLEVGLSVFDVLAAESRPMMLKEVAAQIDMHPAKVHRYLVSLVRSGYAQQFANGRYGVGDKALVLGLATVRRTEHLQQAQKDLQALQLQINECVQVAKWTSLGPLVVQFLEPNHPVMITARVGSLMPVLRSATGNVFASYLPEHIVRPLMDKEWAESAAGGVSIRPQDWAEFLTLKETILNHGLGVIEGNLISGVNALSAPIFDANGEVVFAITCMGNAEHIQLAPNSAHAQAIKATAAKISRQLGHKA
ncbi:MAG: IclR family transcriptional regulator [Neisseriaceae bacterium]|nr:IclR family transcriptional regulator [Neisseriaceae bacterium]MBP6862752.1 IclR family transcriptional regulator [Neisseriaceae bacterium]